MDFTVFLWFYYFVSLLKFVTGNDYYSESDEKTLSRERRSVVNFYRTGQKLQGEMSRTLNQLWVRIIIKEFGQAMVDLL